MTGETDYNKLCEDLESQEIEAPSGVATSSVYSQLLAVYLLQNDLNNAKYLWKRIPPAIKNATPELAQIWEVGQKMWQRDFVATYLVLDKEWPETVKPIMTDLQENLRSRAISLVSQAYSSISAEDLAQFVGMPVTQAVEAVVAQGWTADAQSRMITPKKREKTQNTDVQNEQHLSRLTDFVSFLEN